MSGEAEEKKNVSSGGQFKLFSQLNTSETFVRYVSFKCS